MIYLASPYSDSDPSIVEKRFKLASQATVIALNRGEIIYSPIVHCHQLAIDYDLPKTFDFWQSYNFGMINHCTTVFVLAIDGWDKSVGVAGEIEYAKKKGKPVVFVDENFKVVEI